MNNGDGNRTVLWVSGCSHACKGCHNVETWNEKSGKEFSMSDLMELFGYLNEKHIDGLTISGGDPLHDANYKDVLGICKMAKKWYPDKNIWIWTGYTLEELAMSNKTEIFKYIDCLIDGKYEECQKNIGEKMWRGSLNQKQYFFKDGNVIDIK
ncbi:MAG: anaerobic ribonucleoside-triphosphate reductase activating protein [Aeromonas jandaei]